jgi:hypothetical protein
MIEVQHQRIRLAAVYAWMLEQVCDKQLQVPLKVDTIMSARGRDISVAVSLVVTAVPRGVALAAVAVQDAARDIFEAEVA